MTKQTAMNIEGLRPVEPELLLPFLDEMSKHANWCGKLRSPIAGCTCPAEAARHEATAIRERLREGSSAHDAAMGELQRERDEARRERDEAKEMQRMAIEQLRRAEPDTLAWLKALDERPLPKSDDGTLFTYHGLACVMMPEDDLRKLEAERDALSAHDQMLADANKRLVDEAERLSAELEAVRAERDALSTRVDEFEEFNRKHSMCVLVPDEEHERLLALDAANATLSAELEKARANERRYLWLRPHLYAQQGDVHIARNGITLPFGVSYYHLSGKELDEAIDIGAAVDLPTTHPGNGREMTP